MSEINVIESISICSKALSESFKKADEALYKIIPSPLVLVGSTALAVHLAYKIRDRISPTEGMQFCTIPDKSRL